jgi:hypothetical protein
MGTVGAAALGQPEQAQFAVETTAQLVVSSPLPVREEGTVLTAPEAETEVRSRDRDFRHPHSPPLAAMLQMGGGSALLFNQLQHKLHSSSSGSNSNNRSDKNSPQEESP